MAEHLLKFLLKTELCEENMAIYYDD